MTIRVAVIGTGFGSSVQVPGFQRLDDVEVVAVASGHLERAQAAAAALSIPHAFDDWRVMLDRVPIDLVSIATPPFLHHEMVLEVARRGLHVLCEKPFALNVDQARAMLEAARAANVVHAVDHEFRFHSTRARIKDLLHAEELGEPRLVRLVWSGRRRPQWDWWSDRARGGGALGTMGSHYVDSLRWWFGEPHAVSALLRPFLEKRTDAAGRVRPVTSDDIVSLQLRLGPRNVVANLSLTTGLGDMASRLYVVGTEGTLVVEDDTRILVSKHGSTPAVVDLPLPRFPEEPGDPPLLAPFTALAELVVEAVRGHASAAMPTFADGLAVQQVLDAAYASSEQGMTRETPA
jgi:predicted dehydrogenase